MASLFPLIGIYLLLTPLFEYIAALNTIHVISNKRIFTISGINTITVFNYDLSRIRNIEKSTRNNGSGDLTLYKDLYLDSDGDKQEKNRGFYSIPDINKVEDLIVKHHGLIKPCSATSATTCSKSKAITGFASKESQDIEERLTILYTKYEKATESRRFVLKTKIITLVQYKQEEAIPLSSRDIVFLSKNPPQSNTPIQDFFLAHNILPKIAVIAVLLFVFLA